MDRKIKLLVIVGLLLQVLTLRAERSSGYCSIRFEPNGKVVMSLMPKVQFFCSAKGQIYTRIWLEGSIRQSDLYDGLRINPNAKIYSRERKLIGRAMEGFNPMQLLDQTDSMVNVVIAGYIENNCLDGSFIIEPELSQLLLASGNNEKLSTFETLIQKYELQFTQENESYTSYMMYEPEFVTQQMHPRLLMVFFKEELISIFHTRPIEVKHYDSIEMGSEYKMIFNSKFSEHTKSDMVAIYKKKLSSGSK